jgi:hypothetical protein
MTGQFLNHLLERASLNKIRSEITPALTPEMIPEVLRIPEYAIDKEVQQHIIPINPKKRSPMSQSQTEASNKEQTKSDSEPQQTLAKGDSAEPQTKSKLITQDAQDVFDNNTPKTVAIKETTFDRAITSDVIKTTLRGESGTVEKTAESNLANETTPRYKLNAQNPVESNVNQDSARNESIRHNNTASNIVRESLRKDNIEPARTLSIFAPNSLDKPQFQPVILSEEKFINPRKNQNVNSVVPPNIFKVDNSEPTVTVSIGRIEVRAILPEKASEKVSQPALSLQDYLKRRQEENF